MFILPVKIDETGAIMVDGDVPSDAVCTVMDATGCRVYMPGDELPSDYYTRSNNARCRRRGSCTQKNTQP